MSPLTECLVSGTERAISEWSSSTERNTWYECEIWQEPCVIETR